MKNITRSLVVILWFSMMISFSRQANPSSPKEKQNMAESEKEKSKKDGLRKVTQNRNWDIDEEIDNTIEIEMDRVMRSVEEEIKNLDIHVEPFEIDIPEIDVDIDGLTELAGMNIDIDIDPFDFDDIDIDVDFGNDFDWDEDEESYHEEGLIKLSDDQEKDKDKRKLKEKSEKDKNKDKDKIEKGKAKVKDKNDDDKSKGLKKIN